MNKRYIISQLKKENYRHTKAWDLTIEYISKVKTSFTAEELHRFLKKNKITQNKTSVYRKIEKLKAANLLQQINTNENITLYELEKKGCHHHVICTNCGKIIHVQLEESIMKRLQEKLSRKTAIVINTHQLEFFGKCKKC